MVAEGVWKSLVHLYLKRKKAVEEDQDGDEDDQQEAAEAEAQGDDGWEEEDIVLEEDRML